MWVEWFLLVPVPYRSPMSSRLRNQYGPRWSVLYVLENFFPCQCTYRWYLSSEALDWRLWKNSHLVSVFPLASSRFDNSSNLPYLLLHPLTILSLLFPLSAWVSFVAALLSAVASASKAILSKKVLDGKPLGENLTPANMFAVLSILGFLMILPISLAVEPPARIAAAWAAARAKGYSAGYLTRLLAVSGFLYYIYNEVGAWGW